MNSRGRNNGSTSNVTNDNITNEKIDLEEQRMKIQEMKEELEQLLIENYNDVFLTVLRREQVLQSIIEILDRIHDHPSVNHSLVRTGVRQLVTLSKELKEVSLKCVFKIVNWTIEESRILDEEAAVNGTVDSIADEPSPPPKFMFSSNPSNSNGGTSGSRAATANDENAVEYLVKMYSDVNTIVVKLRILCESRGKKVGKSEVTSDSESSESSEEGESSSIWATNKSLKSKRLANKINTTALKGVFNLHDPLFIQSSYHLENFSGKRALYAAMLIILDAVKRENQRAEAANMLGEEECYSEDEFEKISPLASPSVGAHHAHGAAGEEANNRKRLTAIARESGLHVIPTAGHIRAKPPNSTKPSKVKPIMEEPADVSPRTPKEDAQVRSEEHAKLIGATPSAIDTPPKKLKKCDNRSASMQEVNKQISVIMQQQTDATGRAPGGDNRSSPSPSTVLPFSLNNASNIHSRVHGGFSNAMVDPKTGVSYRKCKVLGQGAFAKVFECLRDTDMKEVACKIFDNPGPDDDEATSEYMVKCMEREIRILGLIQTHATLAGGKQADQSASVFSIRSQDDEQRLPAVGSKSVVGLLDHFVVQDAQHPVPMTCMVLEKMQYTLLSVPVDRASKGAFSGASPIEMLVKSVMQQILAALAYVHSLGIIHRYKLPSVLVSLLFRLSKFKCMC
mgnify:CR=1 FL=1